LKYPFEVDDLLPGTILLAVTIIPLEVGWIGGATTFEPIGPIGR
jgi:hypothetical protein